MCFVSGSSTGSSKTSSGTSSKGSGIGLSFGAMTYFIPMYVYLNKNSLPGKVSVGRRLRLSSPSHGESDTHGGKGSLFVVCLFGAFCRPTACCLLLPRRLHNLYQIARPGGMRAGLRIIFSPGIPRSIVIILPLNMKRLQSAFQHNLERYLTVSLGHSHTILTFVST